jgi:D-alanyl-D-alanine carboxypeptidase
MNLENKLQIIFHKANKKFPHLQVYVQSKQLNKPLIYSPKGPKQKFHSASVGKLATAYIIIRYIDRQLISFDTPIHSILDAEILHSLYVFQGTDYADKVTIFHLLGHTSGINDYFEGITDDRKSILDIVIQKPDHFFTPEELVQYTATKQEAVGKPGDKYLYSDTGYILLGLIIEQLAKKPFFEVLREEVFNPLGMKETGLIGYDPIAKQDYSAPVIVKKQDIRLYKSLSIDFSGGGLLTTLEDLSKLVNGLTNRQFISQASFNKMATFNHHFKAGMFYGLGLMELRFEKFFFLLKGLPRFYGHLGVLGVHAWVDPKTGDTIIINVSDMRKMVASFNLLISLAMAMKQSKIGETR